jgi:putative ATPase
VDRERGLGAIDVDVAPELLRNLAAQSQGDARVALSVLELAVTSATSDERGRRHVDRRALEGALQRAALYYDRAGEEHFNHISALHKSMRNSDPDGTLYWLGRMLEAGEDPLYIARRIVRFASEDVGLADPQALLLSVAAKEAVHFVGRPEADLSLAEAAVYCALAPKSNALYVAWEEVQDAIRSGATEPVPMAIRNAVTGLMAREGYGTGYRYAHDFEDAVTDLECLPDTLRGRRFYRPTDRGLERTLGERIEEWRRVRANRTRPSAESDS